MNEHSEDPDAPDLIDLTTLTMRGRSALASGDGNRALDLLSHKHDGVVKLFGSDSAYAGTSFIDLAEALHLVGRLKESRAAIDQALVIFKRLDRRDAMRERLESVLIEICRRQGHSFVVDQLLQDRIAEGRGSTVEQDLRRAIDQDELAMMFVRKREYEKALPLLMESKGVFERAGASAKADLAICCKYISRVYLQSGRFDESVEYGRKAVDVAGDTHGADSLEATMASDELAVAIAFCARRDSDPAKARESIGLSESAAQRFTREQGPGGKEAARSWDNNRRLKKMLQPLLASISDSLSSPSATQASALPTYSFISHSYADTEALGVLLDVLPNYVKPVVFEAINAPPTEYVSDNLVSGVLGADGFIFIDSAVSMASFWCAFERDLAARKKKLMFRFDVRTRAIEPIKMQPRELKLTHCFHDTDTPDVRRVMRWLVDERSFVAFHDEQKFGERSFPAFASMPDKEREMHLFSLRTFGTIYLLFISDALIADEPLRNYIVEQLLSHPRSTVTCWLSPKPPRLPRDLAHALSVFPREHQVEFKRRPLESDFNVHELDDLCVRLFWVHHNTRSGDWTL